MKVRFSVIHLLVLGAFLLAACGGEAGGGEAPTSTLAATVGIPESGGEFVTATLPAATEPAAMATPVAEEQEETPAVVPVGTQMAEQASTATETASADQPVRNCVPTAPDALGPFYKEGAPVRIKVGEGYVLEGAVLSANGCEPIANAQVEFWMAGPDGEYRDEYRATIITDEQGRYRFESHAPPPYSGRPPHIHLRVTAPGHQPLVTQHYPADASTGATFDLVLESE